MAGRKRQETADSNQGASEEAGRKRPRRSTTTRPPPSNIVTRSRSSRANAEPALAAAEREQEGKELTEQVATSASDRSAGTGARQSTATSASTTRRSSAVSNHDEESVAVPQIAGRSMALDGVASLLEQMVTTGRIPVVVYHQRDADAEEAVRQRPRRSTSTRLPPCSILTRSRTIGPEATNEARLSTADEREKEEEEPTEQVATSASDRSAGTGAQQSTATSASTTRRSSAVSNRDENPVAVSPLLRPPSLREVLVGLQRLVALLSRADMRPAANIRHERTGTLEAARRAYERRAVADIEQQQAQEVHAPLGLRIQFDNPQLNGQMIERPVRRSLLAEFIEAPAHDGRPVREEGSDGSGDENSDQEESADPEEEEEEENDGAENADDDVLQGDAGVRPDQAEVEHALDDDDEDVQVVWEGRRAPGNADLQQEPDRRDPIAMARADPLAPPLPLPQVLVPPALPNAPLLHPRQRSPPQLVDLSSNSSPTKDTTSSSLGPTSEL